MNVVGDRLVLVDAHGNTASFPWGGHWPPPQRIIAVRTPDAYVLVDPNRQSEYVLDQIEADHAGVSFVMVQAKVDHPRVAQYQEEP